MNVYATLMTVVTCMIGLLSNTAEGCFACIGAVVSCFMFYGSDSKEVDSPQ